MAILKDLIVHGSSRFLNKIYANELEVSAFEADSAVIKKLKANEATVVGLLDVQGQLHTNTWTNSNIATIDGCFYITPTLSSDSGKISFSSTSVASLTGTYAAVTSLYIGDSSSGSTVQWTSGSNVLLTGEVEVNGQWLPLGTLLGTLSANATTSSIELTGLTDNRHNTSSIITDIRNAVSNTSLNYRNLKISLYQRKDGTDSKPLGIYMTAMGANGKTFIDIYGGVNATTTAGSSGGFADPNLRIGNLSGLGAVEGTTPTGWGIYTTNGYFKGVIVSSAGKIGGWNIGANGIFNGITSVTTTGSTAGTFIGTGGISNYKDTSTYVNIQNGVITAKGVKLTGQITATSGTIGGASITGGTLIIGNANIDNVNASKINAGDIAAARIQTNLISAINAKVSDISALTATLGGFQVDNTAIHTKNVEITSNVDNSIALSSADFTRTINNTSRTGLRFAIGDKLGITGDGIIYASSVDLTGKITATSGKIGGINITNGKLDVSAINIGDLSGEIGGRNLLRYTSMPCTDLAKIGASSSNWSAVVEDNIQCIKGTGNNTTHLFSYISTNLGYQTEFLKANTTYTYSAWIKVSKAANFDFTHYGHFQVSNNASTASDKTHEDVVSKRIYEPTTIPANTWTKIRLTFTTNNLNGSTFGLYPIYNNGADTIIYMYGWKLEKGNKATDWSPAPEDVDNAIDNIEIGGRNFVLKSKNLETFTNESKAQLTRTEDSCSIVNTADNTTKYGIYNDYGVSPDMEYAVSAIVSNISGNVGWSIGDRTSGSSRSGWMGVRGYTVLNNGLNTLKFKTPSDCNAIRIYIYTTGNGSGLTISKIKFEKGNKATDWSPAPEDVDAGITSASQTATNYLYASSQGLKIANSNPSTASYYQLQKADQTAFYVNNKLRSEITYNGFYIYDNNNNQIASFDTSVSNNPTITLGKTNNKNVKINNNGITINDGQETLATYGDSIIIGKQNESHLQMSSTNISAFKNTTEKYYEIGDGSSEVPQSYTVPELPLEITLAHDINSITSVKVNGTTLTTDAYDWSSDSSILTILDRTPYAITSLEVAYKYVSAEGDDAEDDTITDDTEIFRYNAVSLEIETDYTIGNNISISQITIDGTSLSNSDYTINNDSVTLKQRPASGSEVVIMYYFTNHAPYFIFNTRDNNYNKGNASASFGTNGVASGDSSFVLGIDNKATGRASTCGGIGSFVSGAGSGAIGNYLSVIGSGTFACGRYNVPESAHLFSVGNGTATARSNAFSVSEGGTGRFAGDLQVNKRILMRGQLRGGIPNGGYMPMFSTKVYTKIVGDIAANSTATGLQLSITRRGYLGMAVSGMRILNYSGGSYAHRCNVYIYTIVNNASESHITFSIANLSSNKATNVKVEFTIFYITRNAVLGGT